MPHGLGPDRKLGWFCVTDRIRPRAGRPRAGRRAGGRYWTSFTPLSSS